MRQGYFATTKAVRDFNIKLIEIGQVNAMAMLKFAQQVATAKRPSEAAIFCSSQAGKRLEMVTSIRAIYDTRAKGPGVKYAAANA